MHKTLDLISEKKYDRTHVLQNCKIEDGKKNIIFLDIDGVIQPYDQRERFDHDLIRLIDYLCEKYNDPVYRKMDKYDVGAAYYDWDDIAVGILTKLIRATGSYIVIHSDWRTANDLAMLKALFRLYNLDDYVIDACPEGNKEDAVFEYIEKNRDWIHRYAVIDDADMTAAFGHCFVRTSDIISMDDYRQCINVLSHTYSLNIEGNLINVFRDDQCILKVPYVSAVIQGESIFFLRYNKCCEILIQKDCLIADNYLFKMLYNKTHSGIVAIDEKDSKTYEVVNQMYYHPVEIGNGYVMFYKPFKKNWLHAFDIYDYNRGEIAEYVKGIINKLTITAAF